MMKAVHACGFLLAALVLAHPVQAEQLDAEACAKLKTVQSDLEKEGVRSSMERGPVWARANLPPAKLDRIRTLIDTDEQILFRCPHAKPLIDLTPEEPEPPVKQAKHAGSPKDQAKDQARDKPKAEKPPAKKAAKPAATSKSAAAEAPAADGTPPKRAVGKPKPKVDDAYRPPAPENPGANPFAPGNGPPPAARQ